MTMPIDTPLGPLIALPARERAAHRRSRRQRARLLLDVVLLVLAVAFVGAIAWSGDTVGVSSEYAVGAAAE